ncbi:MAG: hypothetical protein CVU06_03745 [Bacteroidetes bacterium HGW-Bacteroidetes-22]|nr:MAG: hypothetical protein CVU06_03745 [Bacteroidetes bacterium HGW-Bacteroidetes-22]
MSGRQITSQINLNSAQSVRMVIKRINQGLDDQKKPAKNIHRRKIKKHRIKKITGDLHGFCAIQS